MAFAMQPLTRPIPLRSPRLLPPSLSEASQGLSPPLSIWGKQAAAMWVSAAFLGPLCDGRHSAHDVLHYNNAIFGAPWLFSLPGSERVLLETCWWVPVAFGELYGAASPSPSPFTLTTGATHVMTVAIGMIETVGMIGMRMAA